MKNLRKYSSLIRVAVIMVVVAIVAVLNVATSLFNAQGQGTPATTGGGQLPPGIKSIVKQFEFAPVQKTGQTECFDVDGNSIDCTGTGQDGDKQAGVNWPNPRFTDNGDDTVRDNLTYLIWDVSPIQDVDGWATLNWEEAIVACETSTTGGFEDWRLPNIRELQSLITYGLFNPAIPDTTGTGQWSDGDPFAKLDKPPSCWTSTTLQRNAENAWIVETAEGFNFQGSKIKTRRAWCVRGGP